MSGQESTDTDDSRDAALQNKLLAFARYMLRRWGPLKGRIDPEDLVQEVLLDEERHPRAPTECEERLRYLRKRMVWRARDHNRRLKRLESRENLVETAVAPVRPETNDHLPNLSETLARITNLLLANSWEPRSPKWVDLYSVVLVHTRVCLALQIGRSLEQGQASYLPDPLSATLAALLPWERAQASRRFHRDWPTISELWEDIAKIVDSYPHRVTAEQISQSLRGLNSEIEVTIDRWAKWVERACERAEKEIGRENWERYFVGLLGRRRRSS